MTFTISKLQVVQFLLYRLLYRHALHRRCLQPCWIAIVEGKLPEECQVQDYLDRAPTPTRGVKTWTDDVGATDVNDVNVQRWWDDHRIHGNTQSF